MENATPHLPEKFAVVAWFLWHKRKKSRLELPSDDYPTIWPWAQAYLHEYNLLHQKTSPQP